jgi:hypothetical protein
VQDTLAPVLPFAPSDLNLECAADVPPPVDLTAVDNCDGSMTVSPTQNFIVGNCLNDFIIVRTWTFSDTCGNTSSVSQTITVADTIAPTLINMPDDITVCDGEPIVFSPPTATDNCSGSPTISCVRSDGLAFTDPYPIGLTTISCTATDICGNSSTESFTVLVFVAVTVDFGSSCEAVYPAYPPAACVDLNPTINGGTGPYTYVWTNNVDPGFLETTPGITVCPLENTSYTVVVTDANGCISEAKVEVQSIDISCKNNKIIICQERSQRSLCINLAAAPNLLGQGNQLGPCGLTPCNGNEPIDASLQISGDLLGHNVIEEEVVLYPNPANSILNLEFSSLVHDDLSLTIYDINGKVMHEETYYGVSGLNKLTLGIENLSQGMYFINLQNGNTRYQHKFVKSTR